MKAKNQNTIRILLFVTLIFGMGGFLLSVKPVLAATGINKQINFQGKVVNTDGTNVSTASYTFLFCIYTTGSPVTACTSGADNDAVWRESKSITVTDGIFQTNLGDTTALPGSVDFNTDNIYLGVNFNANGQMTPLVRFTAAPYAMNADKVGGLGTSDLIVKAATANQTVTSTQTSGTVFGITDTTAISAETKGLSITLSGSGAFDQTGLEFNLSGASGTNLNDIVGSGSTWKVSKGGAATFSSVTSSGVLAANGGITFDQASDTIGSFTASGTILMNSNILQDIGNTGTDFIASTGALTLAGVLTANGGISLAGSQSLSAAALSYVDLGLITHSTTANQGLRLPNAASATPSNPSSGEGYLAWDAAGNQLITYNGAAWTTVGGGSGANTALSNLASVAINTDLIGAVAGGMGIRGGSAANDDLILEGTTNATRTTSYLILQPNGGNVGIGTATPASMLDIFGTANMLRLSYDASNYATLASDSTGNLVVNNSSSAQNIVLIGDGSATDSSVQFDGNVNDYYVGQDDTDDFMHIGTGSVVGTNAYITLDSTGKVGIGDATPSFALDINGDVQVQGGELYITGVTSSASATEGTVYYDNDDDNLYVYANGGWVDLTVQGGGSQTPWAQDINAAGYDLGSLSNLGFQETTGAPTGTDVGFYRDNTGDLTGNVLTGKTFNLAVNGTDEYNFSSTGLTMNSNILEDIGNTGTDFIASTGALTLAGVLTANGGISIGTQALTGTTGDINYTNFDVTGSNGNVDIGGTITAGSGNEVLTLATGKIDADAISLITTGTDGLNTTSSATGLATYTDRLSLLQGCADGQVLKWVESTDTWDCATLGGGSDNSGLESVQVFTTDNDGPDAYNESITAISHIVVELVGAGGQGGAGSTGDNSGGGGAGGYSSEIVESYSANEDVTVGAGGTGGATNGNNGGTTSFGDATADLQATGGDGGTLDGAGGTGGIGTNGDINLQGGYGGKGSTTANEGGADGGASYFGGGGYGAVTVTGCTNGVAPGSGGGGNATATAPSAGCDGANGIVIVWEYSGTAGSDYAEYYETDGSANAGDLVGMGDEMFEYTTEDGVQRMAVLEKASPENRLVGVVSTAPGQLIGKEIRDFAKNPRPIALTGRVPTKVSNMNGAIKKGDLLSASTIPGVAMKSTKAGQIIGSAMEDYNGAEGEIGKITVFVNTGYSTGARTKDLLAKQGVNLEENVLDMGTNIDADKILLAQALAQKKDIRADVPLSEIYTDRVVAGLSIVAPRVVTQELATDIIKSSLTDKVAFQLTPTGEIVIGEEEKEPTSKIDALGNATFAGVVTAKSIRADRIEGLEIFTNKLSRLDTAYQNLSQTIVEQSESVSTELTAENGALDVENTSVALNINTDGKLILEGLVVEDAARFKGETFFEKLATFVGKTIFKDSVEFEKAPVFNKNTAGYAVVKEGADRVEITFDHEYPAPPVVNASLLIKPEDSDELENAAAEFLLVSDIKFIVAKVTAKGFEIRINDKAALDTRFSWVAIAVNDPETFESKSEKKEEPKNDEVAEIEESAPVQTESTFSQTEDASQTEDVAQTDNANFLDAQTTETSVTENPSDSSGSEEIMTSSPETITAVPITSEVQ